MKAFIPVCVRMRTWTQSKLQDERGATMVEYALLAVLIAAALATAVTALSGGVSTAFTNVTSKFP